MDILQGEGAASGRHVCGHQYLSKLQMKGTPFQSDRPTHTLTSVRVK